LDDSDWKLCRRCLSYGISVLIPFRAFIDSYRRMVLRHDLRVVILMPFRAFIDSYLGQDCGYRASFGLNALPGIYWFIH